jgi:hypothetical protein
MLAALLLASKGYAQTDSTKKTEPDTIRVGNFVIIKKNKTSAANDNDDDNHRSINIHIGSDKNNNRSIVSTNWFIFDLGFANWRDKTNYGSAEANSYLKPLSSTDSPFTKDSLKIKTTKSSNVNVWLFIQKLNVSKHVLNFKYGLGLEMYNYRYESNISYHKSPAYIYRDTVEFSKNKLFAGYITVPFMININTTPDNQHGLSLSAGMSAGYLAGSLNKKISDERGKEKVRGDFNLEKWRLAYIAEIGLGPVRLYGSYSINPLHENGLKQYPYAVGIRLSNW